MITRSTLPASFIPYKKLTICSNSLIDGGFLLSMGDILPLVIGKGEKPQIWLQALLNSEKKEFISIVEASISKHPAVSIIDASGMLTIKVQNIKILSISDYNENSAEVDLIDLRPIGFNIYGDSKKLVIGNSTFSSNSMSGGGVLIGFDG
jgi:hypothetical protein